MKNTFLFYNSDGFKNWSYSSDVFRIYITHNTLINESFSRKINNIKSNGTEIFEILPWISRDNPALCENVDGYLLQNIGDITFVKKFFPAKKLAFDISFNVENSESVKFLQEEGADSITLSPECDVGFLPKFEGRSLPEVIIGGQYIAMRTEHCPVATAKGVENGFGCNSCLNGKIFYLEKDDKKFPVLCEKEVCRAIILSCEGAEIISDDLIKSAEKFYGEKLLLRRNILG